MTLRINDIAPNFTANSTHGKFDFHDWIGGGWAVLFSHPKDFTPVCTTELGYLAGKLAEFTARDCGVVGLSIDSVSDHERWLADIEQVSGHRVEYPLIGDPELEIAKLYGMLAANDDGDAHARSALDNATVRSVFVIGPDHKIKLIMTYPMTTGRNFDELLRAIDSLQVTAAHKVATPAQWNKGDDVIVAPALSDNDATVMFGGFETVNSYLRLVPEPQAAGE